MNLGYSYRADGNFLVRLICQACKEPFDAHAMANADPLGRCPACIQVDEWAAQEFRQANP
jgi:hypothetical protein